MLSYLYIPFHARTFKSLVYALQQEPDAEPFPMHASGMPANGIVSDTGAVSYVGAFFKRATDSKDMAPETWWDNREALCKRGKFRLDVIEYLYELEAYNCPFTQTSQALIAYLEYRLAVGY